MKRNRKRRRNLGPARETTRMPSGRPSRQGPANGPGRSIRRGRAPSALEPTRAAAPLPQARRSLPSKKRRAQDPNGALGRAQPNPVDLKTERKKKKKKKKKKTGEQAARAARFGPIPRPPGDFTENPRLFRKRRAPAPPQAPRRGRIERARPGASNKAGEGRGKSRKDRQNRARSRGRRGNVVRPARSSRPADRARLATEKGNRDGRRPTADGKRPVRPETPQNWRGNKKRSGFHRSFSQAEPDRVPRMGRPGDARLNLLCKRFPLQQTSGPRHEAKARARP